MFEGAADAVLSNVHNKEKIRKKSPCTKYSMRLCGVLTLSLKDGPVALPDGEHVALQGGDDGGDHHHHQEEEEEGGLTLAHISSASN